MQAVSVVLLLLLCGGYALAKVDMPDDCAEWPAFVEELAWRVATENRADVTAVCPGRIRQLGDAYATSGDHLTVVLSVGGIVARMDADGDECVSRPELGQFLQQMHQWSRCGNPPHLIDDEQDIGVVYSVVLKVGRMLRGAYQAEPELVRFAAIIDRVQRGEQFVAGTLAFERAKFRFSDTTVQKPSV